MPSTVIRDSRYDARHRVLSIWFVPSGKRYNYRGVPPEIYQAFTRASSKGRYFNRHIRDDYPYAQVESGKAAS